MIINTEKWYKAIRKRKSRRRYLKRKIEEPELKRLKKFTDDLNRNNEKVKIVLIEGSCKEIFTGIIGSYGKIRGASNFAVFIGDTRDQNIEEKVGYIGEAFILEATARGLGTCWVAGTFKPEIVRNEIKLKDYQEIMAITPVGYTKNKHLLEEKIVSFMVSSHKRKDLDELCKEGFKQDWPQWIKNSLECARLAPSAVNRQPWVFTVNNNSITVSIRDMDKHTEVSKKLDCGIAMLHLEVGARYYNKEGDWEYLKSPDVARFTVS